MHSLARFSRIDISRRICWQQQSSGVTHHICLFVGPGPLPFHGKVLHRTGGAGSCANGTVEVVTPTSLVHAMTSLSVAVTTRGKPTVLPADTVATVMGSDGPVVGLTTRRRRRAPTSACSSQITAVFMERLSGNKARLGLPIGRPSSIRMGAPNAAPSSSE